LPFYSSPSSLPPLPSSSYFLHIFVSAVVGSEPERVASPISDNQRQIRFAVHLLVTSCCVCVQGWLESWVSQTMPLNVDAEVCDLHATSRPSSYLFLINLFNCSCNCSCCSRKSIFALYSFCVVCPLLLV
jgi:hypothetical protein